MSILPTWPIAAGAAVLAFAAGFGLEHTRLGAQIAELERDHATEAAQREQVRAADERAARETEQKLLQEAAFALETKQNEIAAINSHAADLAERLRQRPARTTGSGGVPAPRAACAGATGAELSAEDGLFLAGEAARADTLRAALAQCYRQYNSLMPTQ